jgi:hypothetical protein
MTFSGTGFWGEAQGFSEAQGASRKGVRGRKNSLWCRENALVSAVLALCSRSSNPPWQGGGRRFESVRGLFLEDEAAANRGFFVAATDTIEHLLVEEGGVDGCPAQREKSKRLQTQRCRNGNCGALDLGTGFGDRFIQARPDDVPINKESLVAATAAMKISSVLERESKPTNASSTPRAHFWCGHRERPPPCKGEGRASRASSSRVRWAEPAI